MIKLGVVAVALTVGAAGATLAQDRPVSPKPMATPQTPAAISDFDRDFLTEAFAGNLGEVTLGQLGLEKASMSQVKDFAQRMVRDHGMANEKLGPIAVRYQITVPNEPPKEASNTQEEVSKLSGAAFDRQYMGHMIKDHEKDIDKYSKAMNQLTSADLRSYAEQTLPVLREHYDMARRVAESIQPPAGAAGGGAMQPSR